MPPRRNFDLSSPLSEAIPGALDLGDLGPPQSFRLSVSNGPDLRFRGWRLDGYDAGARNGRQIDLQLYGVEGGGYVAAQVSAPLHDGETELFHAAPVATVRDCMDLWGWGKAAKAYAKALGWYVAIKLGAPT